MKQSICESSAHHHRRLLAASAPHAGDFLYAPPIPGLRLSIEPVKFRAALNYRIGAKVFPHDGVVDCPVCGRHELDAYGHHALNCGSGQGVGGRIGRHDEIRDFLFGVMRTAQLHPLKEPRHLLDNGEKPGDVFLESWRLGRPAAFDVSVASVFRSSTSTLTAGEQLEAAESRVAEKFDKYDLRCRARNMDFVPVVIESFGGLHSDAVDVVKKIALGLSARGSFYSEAEECAHLFQRLSVHLQRCNGSMIAARMR